MSEELREGQRVRVTYDAVIDDVVERPSEREPDGWLSMHLEDGNFVEAPYTAARAITATEPSESAVEWGLWDEGRERWVRRGYHTVREAGAARAEIERHMSEGDDTNLQIVNYVKEVQSGAAKHDCR